MATEIEWFSPQSEYRPTEYVQGWMHFWFDEQKRLTAARQFQTARIQFMQEVWAKDLGRRRDYKSQYHALLGQEFADRDGSTHPITEYDILVVTPYNVQVNYLRSILPDNTRVGTVDKFQGQEAPIVLISMVISSAEDLHATLSFCTAKIV